jgi:hypothetical protein
MAVYTVHEPLRQNGDALARHGAQVVFVRDAFSWAAFLFGPFWMLRHRMWLVLAIYLAAVLLLGVAADFVGGSAWLTALIALLLACLLGMEGASLRRWTLERRGFIVQAVVVGEDLEGAERRYFNARIARDSALRGAKPTGNIWPPASAGPDVIGLFPEPGASP